MKIEVAGTYHGPPSMGHGGYVAGIFADFIEGPLQVTLRRPTPLDQPLELTEVGDGVWELRDGDDVIASAKPTSFTLEVPTPPTLEEARAVQPTSPSYYNERGVHGQCFGCGDRPVGEGLRVFPGPISVEGHAMVAGTWQPTDWMAGTDGNVDRKWVLAALDCPGAFAFIANEVRAGLLGRIEFEQHAPIPADREYIISGWQVGIEGRKMLAGTAAFDADGTLLAQALATWFGFPG